MTSAMGYRPGETGWMRNKDGLGVWEHRGKVAVVGRAQSDMARRWDENLENSLGVYAIDAAQKAMEDAGVSLDDIDGVISCPGGQTGGLFGDTWAPRPYFEPPYDSEDGLTKVTSEWLIKGLERAGTPLKNVKYINSNAPQIGNMMGMVGQAVGDGLTSVCLALYPAGNLAGRYHQTGENADPYARGAQQWTKPSGWSGGGGLQDAYVFSLYCTKYGSNHDRMAPFIVNQRRNGLMVPWGYYTQHQPEPFTAEDYLAGRWINKPISLFDNDRPVQSVGAFIFATAERARDMKQPPVYILNHSQTEFRPQSSAPTLDEYEAWTDAMARLVYEGSGLTPSELDVINPYDGFALFTQYYLEAMQWHGVKRGEAHDFYAGDISVEGPHPFNSSGGNIGTGRTRTSIFFDCMEQLQERAGPRQVHIKNGRPETAAAGCNTPGSIGWMVFGKSPD